MKLAIRRWLLASVARERLSSAQDNFGAKATAVFRVCHWLCQCFEIASHAFCSCTGKASGTRISANFQRPELLR